MKAILFTLFCCASILAFSQEKVIDKQVQIERLQAVQNDIIFTEEKIKRIEDRLAELPEGESNLKAEEILIDLKSNLLMLTNTAKSIQAFLSTEKEESKK